MVSVFASKQILAGFTFLKASYSSDIMYFKYYKLNSSNALLSSVEVVSCFPKHII